MNKTTMLGYLSLALSLGGAVVSYIYGKHSQEENIKKAVEEYINANK